MVCTGTSAPVFSTFLVVLQYLKFTKFLLGAKHLGTLIFPGLGVRVRSVAHARVTLDWIRLDWIESKWIRLD